MLVLAMMFSVPVFTITTYANTNDGYTFGLSLIYAFSNDSTGIAFQNTFNAYVDEYKDIRTPLI